MGAIPQTWQTSCLTLAGRLDLTTPQCPQLVYWHKGEYYWYAPPYVQISTNDGQNWTTIDTAYPDPTNWVLRQVDLSNYVGTYLRVRFCSPMTGYDGWYIDDVRIDTGPCRRVDFCTVEAPDSIQVGVSQETPLVTGLVYETGVTDLAGAGAGIVAELGCGGDGTIPWSDSSWTWTAATYVSDEGTSDRYGATLTVPSEGTYDFSFRFRLAQYAEWTYADLDGNNEGTGGGNGYTPDQAGSLSVSAAASIEVYPTNLAFNFWDGAVTASKSLTLVYRGPGPLSFTINESPVLQAKGSTIEPLQTRTVS